MEPSVRNRIIWALSDVEAEERVTILYACESGSRAWGFESDDSDYDVRFIYLRPTDWYLTIQDKRDVIEKPIDDELDVSGWDVPKALGLPRKSNPAPPEWLPSPIVYREQSTLHERLCTLMPHYYSPISCMFHYLHMAENNFRKYLKDDQVWTKKYFYVLRPVLACIWIEKGYGVVPMEFQALVDRILDGGELKAEVQKLLTAKRSGAELNKGPRNDIISGFLEKELARLQADHEPPAETRDPSQLDQLFVDILKEVNGDTSDS